MKKTLLLLSVMAASAFSASAYDSFTAGTADAPNYYLIRTERGNPFLSYSAEEVANGNRDVTHLTRLADATEYSLWEVTEGSESGTIVVKNFKEDAYLVGYPNNGNGVTAVTLSEPVNLYLVQLNNKAFSIGTEASGTNFLDANNWNNNCGNWIPNDGGTTWYATMVDLTNADDVASAIQAAQYGSDCESAQSHALAQLQPYAAVEVVADIINKGIEDVKAVKPSATCTETINGIVTSTLADANAFLTTGLNGKTYGLQNLRRAGGDYSFVSVNIDDNNYVGVVNMVTDNTLFEFKSIETGGYALYNKATNTYLADNIVPSTDETAAKAIFPVLNSFGSYAGLSFAYQAERSQYESCLNMNGGTGALTSWYIDYDADGSIWALHVFDEDAVVEQVTATYNEQLSKYIDNVEPCADIFSAGIAEISKLTYSSELGAQAAAIVETTIASANESLKSVLNQKSVQLRSLRNGYVIPNETPTNWTVGENEVEETYGFSIAANPSDAANYDFIAGEDGGYKVYTPVTELYLGPGKKNGGNTSIPQVEEEDAAQVYPVIYHNGNFYGVAFPLSDSDAGSTQGLNTNNSGLHQWQINDAGSIFAIKIMGAAVEISEITADGVRAEGIYDLSGRKLSAPVRGINIINGRKVLVK